jgi:hypothetical protein
MGEQVGRQDRLFYEFCLDEVAPEDHLPRRIDSVLGLEDGVPSPATFSVNRHGRFRDSDFLRKVSRRWFASVWRRAWSRARALPWTPR